jgi:uncharacterized MnhB-related membrane protein
MNPVFEKIIIALLILSALIYLFRRNKKKCGNDCGCEVSKKKL